MTATVAGSATVPQWRPILGSWSRVFIGYVWIVRPLVDHPDQPEDWQQWWEGRALWVEDDGELMTVLTLTRKPLKVPKEFEAERMLGWGMCASSEEAFSPSAFRESILPHDLAVDGAEILQLDIGAEDGKALFVRVPCAEEIAALDAAAEEKRTKAHAF
jgi:hypothetical protein